MSAKANKTDWLVFAFIGAIIVGLAVRAGDSDFTYSDASRHAMGGVFLMDAVNERAVAAPVAWARDYYISSPALGIGRYPPLQAALQVPFYAALGVRPLAARLAGALVWLTGCIFFYEAARRVHGRFPGAFATAVMAAGPAAVRWSGEVMLELPAIAFLCAGAYFLCAWLESRTRWDLYAAVAAVCLAGWIKQPAALLLIVVLAFVISAKGISRQTARELVWPAVLILVVMAPLALLSVRFGRANMLLLGGVGGQFGLLSFRNWLFYAAEIPRYYIGWPAFLFMVAGVVASVKGSMSRKSWLWAAWGVLFYLSFSLVGYKSARLGMFVLPACAWFAGVGMAALANSPRMHKGLVCAAAAVAVGGTGLISFLRLPEPSYDCLEAAEIALTEAPDRILYSGESNGTFIFRVRELSGRHRPVVVRADKVFRPVVVQYELGESMRQWTLDEVRTKVAAVAPDTVVIESALPPTRLQPDPLMMLAEYALSEDFRIQDRIGAPQGDRIRIYLYVGARNRRVLTIDLPGVGMEIDLGEGP